MITSVSEDFYEHMDPKPKLLQMEEFNLEVSVANGETQPLLGYIEARVSVPSLSERYFDIPVLVVPTTEYNEKVPLIVGTNLIRLCSEVTEHEDGSIPLAWDIAFKGISANKAGTVKATQRYVLQPFETRTVTGIVRKQRLVASAVTEVCPSAHCSQKVTVCPRVVSLDRPGTTARVPVKLFNMSAKPVSIAYKANLCELQEVNVLRSLPVFEKEEKRRQETEKEKVKTKVCQGTAEAQHTSEKKPTQEVDLESTDLTEEQKETAYKLFKKWNHVFSKSSTDLGHTDLVEHEIKLSDSTPFRDPPRHIPPGMLEEVRENIKEMLDCGAIQPSSSPFSSNIVVVRKKDGTLRICLDFRKLNKRTVRDAYAMPKIENTLHLLSGSKYFSTLDLKSGYWQVAMKERDKHLTAFNAGPLGFYECNRMPFGLVNAPATFQRLMERCMGDLHLRDCLIYLDDVIIFSQNFEEHLERIEAVFIQLSDHNLKLKASKCHFFQREVKYLGHIVSEEGIQTDPEKLEAVKSWPTPKSTKDVRKFLGFTGYYRRFVKGYASIVRPLNDLLVGHSSKKKTKSSKKTPFVWEAEQQKAFDNIKDKLTQPPILAYANYQLPFVVHTDASGTGLGAVLYQQQGGQERVIAYASRSLKPSEKNYPAHKLEFLALKWAVTEKFHDYLYGCKFTVLTDNNPLTYVQTTAKLDATGHRWMASLASYDFKIRYRSGRSNAAADGLSRREDAYDVIVESNVIRAVCLSVTVDHEKAPLVFSLTTPDTTENDDGEPSEEHIQAHALSSKDWRKAQRDDPVISRVIDHLLQGSRPIAQQALPGIGKYAREWGKLELRDQVLHRKSLSDGSVTWQLVLPSCLREDIFSSLHDDLGHQGRDRTVSLFKQRFYWPGMETWIAEKVSKCLRCIKRKTPGSTAPLVSVVSSSPMEVICMDFLKVDRSKGGYEDILVVTDHFTRYAQAYPTKNQTAKTTARVIFDNFVTHYGFPSRIHSDQGPNFMSSMMKELCELAGMAKTNTTPYHAMGNGMPERFNQTLLKMLGTLEDNQKSDWKSHINTLVHAYNVTTHPSTGFSPYYLLFGRHPKLAIDAFLGLSTGDEMAKDKNEFIRKLKERLASSYEKAKEAAQKAAGKNKRAYDTKAHATALKPGDYVLLRNVTLRGRQKLADKWEDVPYLVVRQPNADIPVFEIRKAVPHARKTRVVHRNLLLPLRVTEDKTEVEKETEETLRPQRYTIPQLRPGYQPTEADDEDVSCPRPVRNRRRPRWQRDEDWVLS